MSSLDKGERSGVRKWWTVGGGCRSEQVSSALCYFFPLGFLSHLKGTVKGGRRQGRQKKRWEDNLREQTVLEFAKSQRAVENREK